jgi:hypothetical protein
LEKTKKKSDGRIDKNHKSGIFLRAMACFHDGCLEFSGPGKLDTLPKNWFLVGPKRTTESLTPSVLCVIASLQI